MSEAAIQQRKKKGNKILQLTEKKRRNSTPFYTT
jgi:hypothetical protein